MFYIPSKVIGSMTLPKEELIIDKKNSRHYEDCGLGNKGIYLGFFGVSRITYIPIDNVTRVFKRLAVSKGFYEPGKIYGTLSYLVVCYEGKERQIRFTHEEELDKMLEDFRNNTTIPVGKLKDKTAKIA